MEAQKVLEEQQRKEDELAEQLRQQEQEHKIEADIALEQQNTMQMLEEDSEKQEAKKVAPRPAPIKRSMTKREILLEQRRQKALEREAAALAKSPKSIEGEDLGTLMMNLLRELEDMTSDVEPKGQTEEIKDNENEDIERAKQTNAAVKFKNCSVERQAGKR